MNTIYDFHNPENSSFVGWMLGDNVIKLSFDFKIYAVLLKSEIRVVIVELNGRKNNAYIYNSEGLKVKTISNPDTRARCFGDVYYIKDELTLINVRNDASMMAVVINEDGDILRSYETR